MIDTDCFGARRYETDPHWPKSFLERYKDTVIEALVLLTIKTLAPLSLLPPPEEPARFANKAPPHGLTVEVGETMIVGSTVKVGSTVGLGEGVLVAVEVGRLTISVEACNWLGLTKGISFPPQEMSNKASATKRILRFNLFSVF
jgi:hypothetical protein